MKKKFYSETMAGKWAAALTVFFIASVAIKLLASTMQARQPIPTPILAAIGIAGAVLGVISYVRNKDRTILTLLSIPVGLLIIFWMAAEMAIPH
jgi:membrane associated rhomboid family serine protease